MKKRNGLLYLAFSAVLMLGACTEETDVRGDRPEYDTTPMHFNFSTTPMEVIGDADTNTRAQVTKKKEDKSAGMDVEIGGSVADTRAVSGIDESVIREVSIFQFEQGATGKLLYQTYASGGTGSSTSVDAALVAGSGTTPVCVVANMGDLTGSLNLTVGATTRAQFEAKVALTLENEGALTVGTDLPMMGWQENVTVSSSNTASVDLKYMVAKVVLDCKLAGTAKVKNMTIKMKNVPNGISIAAPTAAPADPAAGTYLEFAGTTCADNTAFENVNILTWYVPESKRADSTNPLIVDAKDRCENLAPAKSMYIEIAGTYVFADNGECPVVYQIFLGSDPTNPKNFTVERGKQYKVTATIKGLNVADSRILVGTDLSPWNGTKFETANCYMVPTTAGKWYRFKGTIQGNGRTDDDFVMVPNASDATKPLVAGWAVNAVEMNPTSANVLWQTDPDNTAGNAVASAVWSKNGYVVFNTKSEGSEGNAVIAVKGSAGDILWSWHIWKTAYVPDPTKAATVDVFKVRNNTSGSFLASDNNTKAPNWQERTEISMTRNLGAANNTPGDELAGGLLYQWGRKDPFVGSINYAGAKTEPYHTVSNETWYDGSTGYTGHAAAMQASGEGAAAVAAAIKNPMTFYTQKSTDTYDWVAGARADQNDNLWGNPNRSAAPSASQIANPERGAKSIYDPCPYGWRVAPQDTWTSFTKTYDTRIGGNNFGGNATDTGWKTWNVVGNENPDGTDYAALKTKFETDKGWTFYYESNGENTGKTTYFPASGYRHRESGSATNVGTEGYCRSSSSFGTGNVQSGALNIYRAWVSPLGSTWRGHGFPVRCVQE